MSAIENDAIYDTIIDQVGSIHSSWNILRIKTYNIVL